MAHKAAHHAEPEGWLYRPRFPERWTRRPLYSLAQWVNGLAFRDIQFSESGKPVIKIAEIKDGITGQTKFTTQVFDESVHVTSGDLLFSWSGQPETSIDAFWWRGPDGWLNQHVFKVTPKPEIDRTFFFYLLRYLRPHFVAIARNKQTTGLGHVTKRDLEHIEAAYPSMREQRAIAAVLGALDDKIELNRRMCRTLEGIAQALFQAWFVDFLPVKAKAAGAKRFRGLPQAVFDTLPAQFAPACAGASPLGPIPKGWAVRPIGEVVDVVGGGTPSTEEPAYWEGGTHAFCTPKDMAGLAAPVLLKTERCLTDAGVARVSSGQLPRGTVLLSSRAPIGYLAIAEIPVSVNQGIIAMRCPREIPNVYVLLWARANMDRIEANANGSTFQEISKRNFRPIPMLVPDSACLSAFGQVTETIYQRIVAGEQQIGSLAALRDALLPKLVSGELRIRDVERIIGRCA